MYRAMALCHLGDFTEAAACANRGFTAATMYREMSTRSWLERAEAEPRDVAP